MIKLTPTSLKVLLACPRSYWLSHRARAPRDVPAYVLGGRALDTASQTYLAGPNPGADGPDTDLTTANELAALVPELPAPGTCRVQHRLSALCPGLEGLVTLEATADYTTPPNAGLVVIGDVKRIWHASAAMCTDEQAAERLAYDEEAEVHRLSDDVQAQLEAWLVWNTEAPAEVIWNWNYLVRETRNAAGVVTRKPKAFTVTVKADRARVEAWFERVVLPAARVMLEMQGPPEAIEHDPDSCEQGVRCFVRSSCALHQGPVKGAGLNEKEYHVDLSRFKTNKAVAETIAEGVYTPTVTAARIAINPPPLTPVAQSVPDALVTVQDTPSPMLDVQAVEGSPEALAMLGVETADTEAPPAPAPRRRRAKAAPAPAEGDGSPGLGERIADLEAQVEDLNERNARQAQMLEDRPMTEDMSTEDLRDELISRGYRVWLESRA